MRIAARLLFHMDVIASALREAISLRMFSHVNVIASALREAISPANWRKSFCVARHCAMRLLICVPLLAGCDAAGLDSRAPAATTSLPAAAGTPAPTQGLATAAPTVGATASPLPTKAASATTAPPTATPPRPTPGPDDWQDLPVVPTLSARALEIYRRGQQMGANPRAFSKIGDCESAPDWFLADFDKGPAYYDLGPYRDLQAAIDYFAGSHRHLSLAVKPGFTTTSVLTPLWADPKQCSKDESPLACEYRITNPAFAIIMLGPNNTPRPERFEPQMRTILDQTIARGIVPVLVTKADNLEGDHQINQAIARLAFAYEVPLWNYWRAVQELPGNGLQADRAHLTWGPNRFDDPANLKHAWPVRNLTALQVLDALMKATAGL